MGAITPDADVLIGFLDEEAAHHTRAAALLESHRDDDLVVAASTYSELLVRPIQNGTDDIVDEFLDDVRATIVALDPSIARAAAALQAEHGGLSLPGAIALATARARRTTFLTFDQRLAKLA